MGEHSASGPKSSDESQAFMKALLADVRALEVMLERGMFETSPQRRRVGAEQEMFLVDGDMRPAPIATQLLEALHDEPRVTSELARFNLEANVSPRFFRDRVLRELEDEVQEVVSRVDHAANAMGAQVLLAGILPTLRRGDLTLANMTPIPRYRALNDTLVKMRGGDFHILIKGVDELNVVHDNVMFEACNTSFQIHFQVSPEEFGKLYNVAQLVTGPVLAAAVNSPMLFGARLWNETRVALFSSSIDHRSTAQHARGFRPRVTFGDQWVEESVLEIFREQIARFRVVLSTPETEDPMSAIERGVAPRLDALRLHNGTVYRWNRACYGFNEGVAHLRIENRVLPAGPTILDEIANAAFFFGLMSGVLEEVGDPKERIDFDVAKDNFFAAARHGLKAQFTWLDNQTMTASELIRERLLPLAREGLRTTKIAEEDIERYLGVIEARVNKKQTGASWALDSVAAMGKQDASIDMRERQLLRTMIEYQHAGTPVHEWQRCELPHMTEQQDEWRRGLQRVGQFMSTDLFTVRETDLVDLAASVMDWEHIKHVPVEDDHGHLIGLVTHRSLLRLVARGRHEGREAVVVKDVMIEDPFTIGPDTPTLEALQLMREQKVACLPVVESGKLVGLITQSDLIRVSAHLLERFLRGES